MVISRCHLKTLENVYQRYVRTILCIRREDRRTNTSVLTKANTTSIEAMVMQNQIRWADRCIRMSENRLPRQVLFAQLTHGVRTRGSQRNRFKDTAKHDMKKCQIYINAWEFIAADRPFWRRSIYQATAKFETNRLRHGTEKLSRRKEKEMSQHLDVSLPSGTSCPHCNKIYRSRIGLMSHLRTNDRPLEDVILVSRDCC